jgi:hypothetical protein
LSCSGGWIRISEPKVGDHREKLVLLPLDHHELPGLDVLHTVGGIQLHLQTLGQRAPGDDADVSALLHKVVLLLSMSNE